MRVFTSKEIMEIWDRLRAKECCDEATVGEFFDEILKPEPPEPPTSEIKPSEINVAAAAMREIATKIESGEIKCIEISQPAREGMPSYDKNGQMIPRNLVPGYDVYVWLRMPPQ